MKTSLSSSFSQIKASVLVAGLFVNFLSNSAESSVQPHWSEYIVTRVQSLPAPFPEAPSNFKARVSYRSRVEGNRVIARPLYIEIYGISHESKCPDVSLIQKDRRYDTLAPLYFERSERKCWMDLSSEWVNVEIQGNSETKSYSEAPLELSDAPITLITVFPLSITYGFSFQLVPSTF